MHNKGYVCVIKKYISFFKRVIAVVLLAVAVVFSGCTVGENPDLSTPGLVDEIGDNATPQSSYNAVKPTPIQDPESTLVPYDPVINFTDPYFESVVRDMLGKSIGDILVSDVAGITSIKARVKGIRNIGDIVYFSSLEELDLYGNKINDVTPLAQLSNLRTLNIGKNFNTLYTSGVNSTNGLNLNVLSSLPLLEELYAEDNKISDLSFVESLTQLKILNLANNNLSDVTALSSLSNLETLILSNNKITDLGALSGCVKLTYIDASKNYYEVMDSETLFYTGYGIKDLSFTKNLSSLTYLNVSMNMVTTLESVAKLKSLRSVYADDNYITDISYFKGNASIQLFSVKRNYIKDFSAVTDMKGLTELQYAGNPIADTEPIKKFEMQN